VTRLVTLAPSLTELAIVLGAGDRVVGVTRFDDAPAVSGAVRVGGYSDPSPETIIRLAPDLVVCQPSPGNRGAVQLVADAGIPVQVLPLSTLADVLAAVHALGKLLGREDAARALIDDIAAARTRAREAAARRGTAVGAVLLVGVEPLVAAGPGSFGAELLADAGARNVIEPSAAPFPRLSPEHLMALDPRVVLMAPSPDRTLAGLPLQIRPRAVLLRSQGLARPGPGIVEALRELTEILDAVAARRETPP